MNQEWFFWFCMMDECMLRMAALRLTMRMMEWREVSKWDWACRRGGGGNGENWVMGFLRLVVSFWSRWWSSSSSGWAGSSFDWWGFSAACFFLRFLAVVSAPEPGFHSLHFFTATADDDDDDDASFAVSRMAVPLWSSWWCTNRNVSSRSRAWMWSKSYGSADVPVWIEGFLYKLTQSCWVLERSYRSCASRLWSSPRYS